MTKFFLYTCRHGDDTILTNVGEDEWNYLLNLMESCNGMTLSQIKEEFGEGSVDGSYEQGHLSVDDGGQIGTIELTFI